MRLAALLAALALVGCSSVTLTPSPSPTPTPVPLATGGPVSHPTSVPTQTTFSDVFDTPLRGDAADRLHSVLAGHMADDAFASMSVAVVVPNVGYWEEAAGLADRDNGIAATPDAAYAIGFITETFVGALTLRLAEDGYLDLDDLAADYLGPLAASKSNGATVRQLLSQSSGIDSYLEDSGDGQPWTLEELLNLVGPPPQRPGVAEHSSTNYLLLGLIAEVVTGGPLGELLQEYLLDRFDLERTYYAFGETVDDPIAHGYHLRDGVFGDTYDGSGQLPSANAANAASALRGAGAMASTAPDLARWMALLCGGDVLAAESQSEMFNIDVEGQGLGVAGFDIGSVGRVIGGSGGGPGTDAHAYCDADTGAVVVVLSTGGSTDATQLLDGFFGAVSHALD